MKKGKGSREGFPFLSRSSNFCSTCRRSREFRDPPQN